MKNVLAIFTLAACFLCGANALNCCNGASTSSSVVGINLGTNTGCSSATCAGNYCYSYTSSGSLSGVASGSGTYFACDSLNTYCSSAGVYTSGTGSGGSCCATNNCNYSGANGLVVNQVLLAVVVLLGLICAKLFY